MPFHEFVKDVQNDFNQEAIQNASKALELLQKASSYLGDAASAWENAGNQTGDFIHFKQLVDEIIITDNG
ncbi:MAG: hypothetical protein PHF86_09320, partial [Candidatus Nanoarchaeia archaeon]|nr:hypothetical protein [Candidatus Nanoarchaeia archaeon]